MKIFLLVTAVVTASLYVPTVSQTSCTTAIVSLLPCLTFITGTSFIPSPSCCSQLANIVGSQPQCLCTLLNGGNSIIGFAINQTKALALPGACKVQTPPVSACSAVTGEPVGSPPEPPQVAPSSPTSPSTTPVVPTTPTSPRSPTSPSSSISPSSTKGNGSKSSKGDSSAGRMNKSVLSIVFSALIFGLSLASFN